jgi:hypothetical protein
VGKTVRREHYDEYDDNSYNQRGAKVGERSSKKRNTLKRPFRNVQYQENDERYDIDDYRDYF